MIVGRFFIIGIIGCFSCLVLFALGANLVPDEGKALQEIADTLGKKNWNFTVDPCSGQSGWAVPNPDTESVQNITCDCTFPNGVCHVISIINKKDDTKGVPPAELVKLPYLREIDFTRTYLNGRIPKEWGSMKLLNISLVGNQLTGPIPKEIGNITTLGTLNVDMNQLSEIPPELGNLTNIGRIIFSSNNFIKLPDTLAKLSNLLDFRINDNQFTGKIPDFIQNWTKLERLEIQGSGLEGPIPNGISLLTRLTNLRISDINGIEAKFPPLDNMTNMKTLVLRSCNLTGAIPEYLGVMKYLKTLDLSFNKLEGKIPDNFASLKLLDFMYLTGNLLNETVQEWMEKSNSARVDLSYSKYSGGNSGEPNCQINKVNLFGSSPLGNNSSRIGFVPCLKKSTNCSKKWYSFHINCGGAQVDVGNMKFEDDSNHGGPSNFWESAGENWAISSTGNFLDSNGSDNYIAKDITPIIPMANNNSELYRTARLSPLSLTYYGFCLVNGEYTVNLHFAEIIFTNEGYKSSGRRTFDIYIQGELVEKDFNIVRKAGGARIPTTITNNTVNVTNGTLEIRFYWAGKGTTGIPDRGNYGPLVSAISVKSNSEPPSEVAKIETKKLSAAVVVGIVASVLCIIFVIIGVLWWKGCLGSTNTISKDLRGLDLQTGSFTLRQIKAATNNFGYENKIGEGGFGPVYKGHLSDGTIIAVKQLSSKSNQGNREFVNEVGMISSLQHANLVRLYGCCIEENQLLLIYEYLENNSLARALFGPEEHQLKLDWSTRQKICVGIARGLAYLHEESRLKIVHRDIKATNILLDKDLNPKISDFGLAKLNEEDNTHISTRIAGTLGYMAPEYVMKGYLTDKADVYSFGVVALEILSGMSVTSYRGEIENRVYLLDWALVLQEKGSLMELVDPRLGSKFNQEEVRTMINVALLCTNASLTLRPTMSAVVKMLEGRTIVHELVSDQSISNDESQDQSIIDNETWSLLLDGSQTGSYISAIDSQFWNYRE